MSAHETSAHEMSAHEMSARRLTVDVIGFDESAADVKRSGDRLGSVFVCDTVGILYLQADTGKM